MPGRQLFDVGPRTENRLKLASESHFSFYNLSAEAHVETVRHLLENWFTRYPDEAKDELRARLRGDDTNFHGAFFELYLHELLTRMGYQVLLHPDIEGEPKHPDFLVLREGEPLFYLEATVVGPSRQEIAAAKREAVVYDALNEVHSPDFFIGVRIEVDSKKPPPGAKLSRRIQKWLRTLDYDELQSIHQPGNLAQLPTFLWDDGDWVVRFTALPKKPDHRGEPGVLPIGNWTGTADWVNYRARLRSSLSKKARAYRNLDRPFLLAVNVLDENITGAEFGEALLGELCIVVPRTDDDPNDQPAELHKPNGVWRGPRGPQNRRLSAVLFARNLVVWSLHRAPILCHNPWAAHPLPPDLWPLPQQPPADQPAETDIHNLLDLPEPWPPW